jgi:hypothetical protein
MRGPECPLWVRNGHPEDKDRGPLYSSKQTLIEGVEKSCQSSEQERNIARSFPVSHIEAWRYCL